MALPNIDINAGTPPLLWSNVQEAFEKINENFTALDLATGGTAVDLGNLFTSVVPATTQTYQLGSQTNRWKSVHTGEYSEVAGSELNGLWAGSAQIKGIGLRVDLPAGSTVAGNLIIDPDKTFFKSAQVDNELRIEANEFSDTLNLNSGTAIQLVVDSSNESITFNNIGVTSAVAGNGISVNSATGSVTITNNGVRSLQSITALPSGRTTGAGININGSTGDNIRITNTGVLGVQQGFGITVSTDVATGIATVSFNSGVAPQTAFTTIAIAGDNPVNNIQSDTTADTLTFAQGYGIILTNNPSTDTMTVALNQRIDIIGSVFADNSTLLVDGLSGVIPASVVQGTFTGNVVGNLSGIAAIATTVTLVNTESTAATHYITFVDSATGNENVRTDTSLTYNPSTNTLTASTFSGNLTGTADNATTVTLVATNTAAATHFITFVDTATGNENVRTDTDLTYNPNTNTLTAGNFVGTITGNVFTNLIDSADSSAIVVTPLMRFESDAVIENDLRVNNLLLVRGQRVILLNDFKALVAASISFADFQARIAALV